LFHLEIIDKVYEYRIFDGSRLETDNLRSHCVKKFLPRFALGHVTMVSEIDHAAENVNEIQLSS